MIPPPQNMKQFGTLATHIFFFFALDRDPLYRKGGATHPVVTQP